MAIDTNKPLPMKIGERYLFTLTSYEPVEVKVTVPYITDDDVHTACEGVLADLNPEGEDITDEWIQTHIPEINSISELEEEVRKELEVLNEDFVENQKKNACITELASRLEQQVPENELQIMREALKQDFLNTLMQQGMSEEEFNNQLENSPAIIDMVIDRQAVAMADQSAALDAYANKNKIEVTEEELPEILGMPEDEAEHILEHAKEAGAIEQLKINAARAKAAEAVFADAVVSYHHETEEEAKERIAEYEKLQNPDSNLELV